MSQRDQSFDGITRKFSRNIYNTNKGRLRLAILSRDLTPCVPDEHTATLPNVLDVGGGLGQLSMLFARAGCQVMHTDISAEIVAQAQQLHKHEQLSSHYQYHVAPLQELPERLNQQYDIVLCHAVLEWLADPRAAIATLKQLLAPQGRLSLMFYNRDAKILANIIFGNFDYVKAGLSVKKTVRMSPQQPIAPAIMSDWLHEQNLRVVQKTGVRCFHDYLRNQGDQKRFNELLELELRYNQQSPFVDIGRYLHWQIEHA